MVVLVISYCLIFFYVFIYGTCRVQYNSFISQTATMAILDLIAPKHATVIMMTSATRLMVHVLEAVVLDSEVSAARTVSIRVY